MWAVQQCAIALCATLTEDPILWPAYDGRPTNLCFLECHRIVCVRQEEDNIITVAMGGIGPSLRLSMGGGKTWTGPEKRSIVVSVSRIVWTDVVLPGWLLGRPPIVRPFSEPYRRPLSHKRCVLLLTVAEALFPLVPMACRAVLATAGVNVRGYQHIKYRSSYFALQCAAEACGDGRCVSWIVSHKSPPRHHPHKECLAVLRGLCVAGHLPTAEQFAGPDPHTTGTTDSTYGRPWAAGSHLRWPEDDGGDSDWNLRDELVAATMPYEGKGSSNTLLCSVCRAGHLETAKWLVSRFRIGELYFFHAFMAALCGGHIDVVEWLAGLFDIPSACEMLAWHPFPQCAAEGGCLEVIKWVFERFPPRTGESAAGLQAVIACNLLKSMRSADEKIEACKWLMRAMPSMQWEQVPVYEEQTLRWLIQSGAVKPSKTSLRSAFFRICEPDLLEWLFKDFSMVSEPENIPVACENSKDSVSVVKCMVHHVAGDLPPEIIDGSVRAALGAANLSVSTWLEDTYHYIERALKNTEDIENAWIGLESVAERSYSGFAALEWFCQRVPVGRFEETEMAESVQRLLETGNLSGALYLLKKLHIPLGNVTIRSQMKKLLRMAIGMADISSAKEIIAISEITQSQVKANTNHLFFQLLSFSKVGCAEWLIDNFYITLSEVINMPRDQLHASFRQISLPTWKMLLRKFPGLTAKVIRTQDKFLPFVTVSPLHIEHTVQKLGVTYQCIVELCRGLQDSPDYPSSTETAWWLAKQEALLYW
ncbi:hypothetical protein Pelo_15138 [Pelomyxa schiedti]|nr:hypothetical protein Pelo_15138 [Pelomyxa schiedti]